ncbi:MAG: peptide chain release factor N(5)-glutamine methyltransferase [Anaerolineae bacterium]|nr:peptide chain release factor N(5)-glutamine methyltransferase [Anaerolineae bacterium]
MNVGEALLWAARKLVHTAERPHLEAEILLMELRQCDRTTLFAHPEWELDSTQVCRYAEVVHRRAEGTPLPYITGHIEFCGLEFAVTPAVLIPRPETELLVERALDWLQKHPSRRIADIGTGSGCIAVTLAVMQRALHITAGDISAAALTVAQTNARHHDVASRVTCIRADLLAPFSGPLDLILSNPPYVADPEWEQLPDSVRQEPRSALLAGLRGLDLIRRLLSQARRRQAPGGCMLVEIGEKQGNAVQALAQTAFPRACIDVLPDLAGQPRLLEVIST